MQISIDHIKEDFRFLESWEDRYQYIIDLGESLEPLGADEKRDENFVQGCMSSVWLVIKETGDGTLDIRGDSDSAIVRGLIAILIAFYTGVPRSRFKGRDASLLFSDLKLETHLSPNRRNGLHAMNSRIQSRASAE
ncbi:MAG: SufE family protein [Spirochaetales bacterium]|nr:SufE family protein [Spirochaetales bacterium]